MRDNTIMRASPCRVTRAAEVAASEERAAPATVRTVSDLPTLHRDAYEHGYREGLKRALYRCHDTLGEIERYRNEPDDWLRGLVFAVLRKVLGETDPTTMIPSLAEQVIAQCDQDCSHLTVYVHRNCVDSTSKRLESKGARMDVAIGPELGPTDCEVHTPFGIVEGGLEAQLDALEMMLDRAGLAERDADVA